MKFGLASILSVAFGFALLLSCLPAAQEDAPRWHTGVLMSADLSGHGLHAGKRSDIWYVYCISTSGREYSVVSRTSPPKAGLTVGNPVRFSIEGGSMMVANTKGERFYFKIMRQGKSNVCR